MKITNHFNSEEFECPHCHKSEMDDEFVEKLETIRITLHKAIHVNSGYRCKTYNRQIGGKRNSAHTQIPCKASDISVVNSNDRFTIIDTCLKIGINRIGIGKNYLHLDMADETTGHPKYVVWHYYE